MMTPDAFSAWLDLMRETRGWSLRRCARELGCSFNALQRWRGEGAPLYIGLACAALAHGLPPFRGPGPSRSA